MFPLQILLVFKLVLRIHSKCRERLYSHLNKSSHNWEFLIKAKNVLHRFGSCKVGHINLHELSWTICSHCAFCMRAKISLQISLVFKMVTNIRNKIRKNIVITKKKKYYEK